MSSHLIIDPDRCVGCGLCRSVCIRDNIVLSDGKASESGGDCFDCGHCFAVCPKGAIRLVRFPQVPDASMSLPAKIPGVDELMGLLRSRRSSRWFTGEPVTEGEFRTLFEAAALSPTAQNAMDVEFAVVDKRLDEFLVLLADILEPLSSEYPRIGQFVRHVTEGGDGPNPFLWEGRQVILSFSSEPVNATIAMTRVELAAQAMGLGGFYSLWMSKADVQDHERFMSFFPEVDPAKRLGAVFVIGRPRVRFRREAPRPEAVVHMMRRHRTMGLYKEER